ncbi:MAG: hypothetical protein DRI77_01425 [Chloroflexi bacterium]|nr:MAG: hypothetical protein DRI77_01425 [Chloroflexota bacterium]
MRRIRLTEDKIARRLELVETLVYRQDQPLLPFRFHPGDDPLVAPDVDDRAMVSSPLKESLCFE